MDDGEKIMKKDREIRRGKWGNRAALALCLGLTLGGWLFTRQLLIRQEEAFLNQEYLAALSLPGGRPVSSRHSPRKRPLPAVSWTEGRWRKS